MADERAALLGAAVTGADTDRRLDERLTEPLGGHADAPQRCPEVLVDIDRQGPQRRDVQHPNARDRAGGVATQRIDRPEEGRQRLAGAGGSAEQRVLARRDRPPGAGLGTGRSRERRLEPGPNRVGEGASETSDMSPESVPTAL